MPEPKAYLPGVVISAGRSGQDSRFIIGPPNSYVRGEGEKRVFELDEHGRVCRDITPDRIKVRVLHIHTATGQVFEALKKQEAPVSSADLDILRKMGVLT